MPWSFWINSGVIVNVIDSITYEELEQISYIVLTQPDTKLFVCGSNDPLPMLVNFYLL